MSEPRFPKCLREKGPEEAYRIAYSLFMGKDMDALPKRFEISARREACAHSESGYYVCISNPKRQVTEGFTSYSKFGPYLNNYYMFDYTDPKRGKMTLEIRRDWGLSGFFKDYSINLWDGARTLIASTEDTWLGQWGVTTGDHQSLVGALTALCRPSGVAN